MSTSQNSHRIVVFTDYVCPFCYLGRAALKQYRDETDDLPAVEWQVFDLKSYKRGPEGQLTSGVENGKDESYFARVEDNVRRLREAYGVEMVSDLPRGIDSWNAQKLSVFARENFDTKAFGNLHASIFDALWQAGRDIGNPEVLVELAQETGIPETEAREAITNDNLDGELKKRFAEARALGINAVPTFAYEGRFVQGAIPPDRLERFVAGDQQIDLRTNL